MTRRLHLSVAVSDLDRAMGFYTALFGVEPSVRKDDYAKWMIDDPRLNFAITSRGRAPGVDHLGFQFETEDDLAAFKEGATARGLRGRTVEDGACCYARSDKLWLADPDGLAWEGFHTHGSHGSFGVDDIDDTDIRALATTSADGATAADAPCC